MHLPVKFILTRENIIGETDNLFCLIYNSSHYVLPMIWNSLSMNAT